MTHLGLDHPDAVARMLRSWDAGQDTAYIAGFISITEAEAARILAAERETRRRQRRLVEARRRRLALAFSVEDVDRNAVALRFGYANRGSAGNALRRWRRVTGWREGVAA